MAFVPQQVRSGSTSGASVGSTFTVSAQHHAGAALAHHPVTVNY
jgi:hypothetical protein